MGERDDHQIACSPRSAYSTITADHLSIPAISTLGCTDLIQLKGSYNTTYVIEFLNREPRHLLPREYRSKRERKRFDY